MAFYIYPTSAISWSSVERPGLVAMPRGVASGVPPTVLGLRYRAVGYPTGRIATLPTTITILVKIVDQIPS